MISGNQKSFCKLQDQICNLVPITGGPFALDVLFQLQEQKQTKNPKQNPTNTKQQTSLIPPLMRWP